MPLWQKGLLIVAAIAGGLGLINRAAHRVSVQSRPAAVSPGGPHSSAFADAPVGSNDPNATPSPADPPQTPWYGRVGLSLVIGFIAGWITRIFLRLMATIALFFALLMGTLSYYHVVNVDFTTAAKQEYHQISDWVTDQASKLKNAALAHVPSVGGAAVGAFLGMRRR